MSYDCAMLEPLLNYEQAATELGIPVRSLRDLVYKGIVPASQARPPNRKISPIRDRTRSKKASHQRGRQDVKIRRAIQPEQRGE